MPRGRGRRSSCSTRRATSSRRCRGRGTGPVSPPSSPSSSRSIGPRARSSRATTPTSRRRSRPTPRLRFPGKAVALPDGSFVCQRHGRTTRSCTSRTTSRRSAPAGAATGCSTSRKASSSRPPDVAERLGVDVLVADSVNHQLKGIRFSDGSSSRRRRHRVASCASAPVAGLPSSSRCRPRGTSPGSAAGVVIAMAGTHQLWAWTPGDTPEDGARRGRRRHVERGARRRPGRRRLVRATDRARDVAVGRPRLGGRLRDVRPALGDSGRRRRARRRDPRRHRPVRLRPPRRRRRRRAAPAPARRHGAARRLGRGQRHLQRCRPPLRPRHPAGDDPRAGPGRAERRRRRARRGDRGDPSRRRRVGRSPPDPGRPARGRPSASTVRRTARSGLRRRCRRARWRSR